MDYSMSINQKTERPTMIQLEAMIYQTSPGATILTKNEMYREVCNFLSIRKEIEGCTTPVALMQYRRLLEFIGVSLCYLPRGIFYREKEVHEGLIVYRYRCGLASYEAYQVRVVTK